MLYIIAQGGVHDTDRKRLLDQAKISVEEAQSLTNLSYLNVKLSSDGGKKKEDRGPYSYYSKKMSKQRRLKNSDAMTYDLSRYIPMIRFLLEVTYLITYRRHFYDETSHRYNHNFWF